MEKSTVQQYLNEIEHHLQEELLPFWSSRMLDEQFGGFITHFDQDGKDTGTDEKSLISQTRSIYTLSSAHRAGYGKGEYASMAKQGIDFLLEVMWDQEYGGFYWMSDRKRNITIHDKIVYGHSFAIYALSEYTLATQDPRGLEYASMTFDLLQKYALDSMYGGYFEMFSRDWKLAGPGSKGGDRKTLDVHMHLMEAFTTLYECSTAPIHKRKLKEDIQILLQRMIDQQYATGIPQFTPSWELADQIKFDIVWGWDRFSEEGVKTSAKDNTSYGHNVELAWLLAHATDIAELSFEEVKLPWVNMVDHAVAYGIDWEYGGVYVEGSHAGEVYDREKEFWQQSEVMIGMLEAYLRLQQDKYWEAYKCVHRFVMEKMIHRAVGEWWPLMSREGKPIWTHMSHSWKVNYHTVRAMIQCAKRLRMILEREN